MQTTLELLDDNSFILGVPITKIDVKKRIVGGFGTLDNVDKAKDVLDANASLEAFSNWPGNIREMHQKVAVGKAVEIKPQPYTDEKTGETYNGIWVEAKISKGAEDTWQKVLDGTLSGFSVGGATYEKQREITKASDGTDVPVWRITKYGLNELSLVDNPCNSLATISLIKSVDGNLEATDIVEKAAAPKPMQPSPNAPQAGQGETDEDMPDIKAVLKALQTWRDKEVADGDDHDLAFISTLIQQLKERVFRGDPGQHGDDNAIFNANNNGQQQADPQAVKPAAKVQKDADGAEDAGAEDTAEDAAESTHPIVAYPAQHLAQAKRHLRAFHGHAAAKGHMRLADYAHNLMMQTHDLHKSAGSYDGMNSEDMCKLNDADLIKDYELEGKILQDNKISGISDIEGLDDQNNSLVKKFVSFLLGDKIIATSEEQVEKDGDTEMDETMLKEALTVALEPLTKDTETKFTDIGESLVKVSEALEKLAKTEDLEELKKSFDETVNGLTERLAALEESGAIKKSGDDAGAAEKLEKKDGFWSDSIVPSFVQAQYKAGR